MAVVRAAYIVAARRTAIGRIGGLHRSRRVEDLVAPVIAEILKDAAKNASAHSALKISDRAFPHSLQHPQNTGKMAKTRMPCSRFTTVHV